MQPVVILKSLGKGVSFHFLVLAILLALYFFVRLYHHEQRVNFADDQGTIAMDTYYMWQKKVPLLVGPKVSLGYEGRFFFHGPAVYYFLLPGMILGNWHPLAGSFTTIVWNAFGVVFLYLLGLRLKSKLLAVLISSIYIMNPFMIEFTSFIWNPNFLPTISIMIAYLLFTSRNSLVLGKLVISKSAIIGLLVGIGLMLHYQTAVLIPVVVAALIFRKQFSIRTLFSLITGILVGIFPYLLFELRHNFYNIQTIFLIISHRIGNTQSVQAYYFFAPLIVLSLILVITIWRRLRDKRRTLLLLVFGVITIVNGYFGFGYMQVHSPLISLPELEKAASIILSQIPENYNILNLTTGDTRASALRYLVTYQGSKPLGVEQYPQAGSLYVLSQKKNPSEIEAYPVWEISSAKRKVTNFWALSGQDRYYLYLLEDFN